MTLANPWYLLVLLIIPVMIAWYFFIAKRTTPTVVFPSASAFKPLMSRWRRLLRFLPLVLRVLAMAALIFALARPRTSLDEEIVHTEGIDLVIALDISTSMLAEDLQPRNRLEAAKQVASEFIEGRSSDRIGLVMFAGESFTWCPLTLDYEVLTTLMDQIEPGIVKDGTAIGKAIATGTNRLRHGTGASKVLILLTDGVNNVDQPDPLTAALAAAEIGVKVYTIGVGTMGMARAPVQTPYGTQYQQVQVEIDEELLQQIAQRTGGMYFRATSTEALRNIYNRIDEMETTLIEVEHMRRWSEEFYLWAAIGLGLLLLERLLSVTVLRNLAM